jgi:Tol biopolymer transport system component
VLIVSAALAVLLAAGCGTLDISIESGATSDGVPHATVTALAAENLDLATQIATQASVTPEVPPTAEPLPTAIPEATELRVAFVKATEHGNNVWLWVEDSGDAVPLTINGGVGDVRISDDGEIVAFTRGDGLWTVGSEGAPGEPTSEERELVSAEDFAAMEGREPGLEVGLYRFDWIPGTHILAFNTQLKMEIGLFLNDDLHVVNADSGERTALLPPGEGGEFHYAPDGSQAAVVTPGKISLVDADGGNRREALTYAPIATASEFQYYPQPVWAADAGSLRVAIPPVDPFAQPAQLTSIWRVRTDGSTASLLTSIAAAQVSQPAFSPDLRYVAHLYAEHVDPASSAYPESDLVVTDLESGGTDTVYPREDDIRQVTLENGDTITHRPIATQIYGWSPDAQYLAFGANPHPELPTQAQIAMVVPDPVGGEVVPAHGNADGVVIDVKWVDATRYLFLAQSARGWDVILGQVGGRAVGITAVVGSPPAFDFAAPQAGAGARTQSSAPPPPFGLIYQNAEGVWHVNVDGESARLFDRPGGAVSPDSAQVLYTEDDDLWLADVATGERRNLSQTPDRSECCPQWWPGRPDTILLSSQAADRVEPDYGFPTLLQLDGTGYQPLEDDVASFAPAAPSPDSQTVAYDRAGQPWLYRMDTGAEPFDLTPYGLSTDPQIRVVGPAWSDDGRQLAWIIGDCRIGECEYSIGVFDLEVQEVQLLHPYAPIGMGGQPPPPTWSPDGRWLAFTAWAMDPDDSGLWVARADGSEEHSLDAASRAHHNPVWSPDGRWLAFSSTDQGAGPGIWLAEVDTWTLTRPDLPPDAFPVAWASPRP